jgi:hypothetical protein
LIGAGVGKKSIADQAAGLIWAGAAVRLLY